MRSPSAGTEAEASPDSNPDRTSAHADPDAGWTLEITPRRGLLHVPIQEIWEYRDLLWMLVQRDIATVYKQTILGPLWYLLQPLMMMLMLVAFGNIVRISTDGVPQGLFYLAGVVVWNYFAETFSRTSNTFIINAEVFGKVYFPRLLVPLSLVVYGLFKFLTQLGLFLAVYLWYLVRTDLVHPNWWLLAMPYLVLLMAGLGLGFGVLIGSATTKYRDLTLVIPFGVQLLMYATPIIYPMSMLGPRMRSIISWNPIAPLMEAFKYGFFGVGEVSLPGLVYASIFTLIILLVGVLVFNRTEQNFMDTV